MNKELRDLRDEEGVLLNDILDLAFGAGMIVAGAAVIDMMIFAKAGWGAHLAGIILFLFCVVVGGTMAADARKNLMRRDENG